MLRYATLTTAEIYVRGDPTNKHEAIVPPHLRMAPFDRLTDSSPCSEGFVIVTAGRLRVAQHARAHAAIRPRGRATRPIPATLDDADIVFLDPDNGLGAETTKHATFSEIRLLRKPGRAVVFITFPGRNLTHDVLAQRLHDRLAAET